MAEVIRSRGLIAIRAYMIGTLRLAMLDLYWGEPC